MEAGHVAQNIHLQTVGLGLGTVPVGTFDEQKVEKIISAKCENKHYTSFPLGEKNSYRDNYEK